MPVSKLRSKRLLVGVMLVGAGDREGTQPRVWASPPRLGPGRQAAELRGLDQALGAGAGAGWRAGASPRAGAGRGALPVWVEGGRVGAGALAAVR